MPTSAASRTPLPSMSPMPNTGSRPIMFSKIDMSRCVMEPSKSRSPPRNWQMSATPLRSRSIAAGMPVTLSALLSVTLSATLSVTLSACALVALDSLITTSLVELVAPRELVSVAVDMATSISTSMPIELAELCTAPFEAASLAAPLSAL